MLSQIINRPCTLLRRAPLGGDDGYGNEIETDDALTTVVEIQQRRRDETDDALSDEDWVAFFLPGEDVRSGDAIVVDGHKFEVIGDPWPARNPRTQTESHVECSLRRTAGPEDAS